MGVGYKPDDATVTGITRTLAITSGTRIVDWKVNVHVYQDNSEVRLRLIFKNSGGSTLATVTDTASHDEGVHDLSISYSVPVNATQVEVGVAALNVGTEFVANQGTFVEFDPGPTDADCDDRAESRRQEKYDECEDDGGTPTGTCEGTVDPTYVGGCKIECTLYCYKGGTEPVEFQCPTGW